MRKAWFTSLQLLVLIFLFLSFSSLRALPAEAGETEAAYLQLSLTLAPAEAVVPGDRITRQILLENLTDKKLKYSVEEIHCSGTAALLPYLTLELAAGEQTLFSERADRLGTMSSFPVSIPTASEDEGTGGAAGAEAASSAENAGAATMLQLTIDFSSEAEASLMGSEAEIALLLSAEEAAVGGETAMPETSAAETVQNPTKPAETESGTDIGTDVDAAENKQPESGAAEERKESAEAKNGAGISGGRSSRGVLFGGAISFLGGPGEKRVLEAAEDPPVVAEDLQQSENQSRESAEMKSEDIGTGPGSMDSRLTALLERLRKRQKADATEQETASAVPAGRVPATEGRSLSISVEERDSQGLRIKKAQSIYGGEAVTIYLGEANMKGSARRIFGALGNLLLWLLIFCAVYFALSAYQERRTGKPFFFMGYKPVLILSESMEPTYPKGAIVLVRKQKSSAEPGDVVMFSPEEGSGTYVIHRIVGESEAGFITRGDHNNTEDRDTLAPERIYGTVKGLIWA